MGESCDPRRAGQFVLLPKEKRKRRGHMAKELLQNGRAKQEYTKTGLKRSDSRFRLRPVF
jgi:hypothetical protein